jgi:hypothetical protein
MTTPFTALLSVLLSQFTTLSDEGSGPAHRFFKHKWFDRNVLKVVAEFMIPLSAPTPIDIINSCKPTFSIANDGHFLFSNLARDTRFSDARAPCIFKINKFSTRLMSVVETPGPCRFHAAIPNSPNLLAFCDEKLWLIVIMKKRITYQLCYAFDSALCVQIVHISRCQNTGDLSVFISGGRLHLMGINLTRKRMVFSRYTDNMTYFARHIPPAFSVPTLLLLDCDNAGNREYSSRNIEIKKVRLPIKFENNVTRCQCLLPNHFNFQFNVFWLPTKYGVKVFRKSQSLFQYTCVNCRVCPHGQCYVEAPVGSYDKVNLRWTTANNQALISNLKFSQAFYDTKSSSVIFLRYIRFPHMFEPAETVLLARNSHVWFVHESLLT